MNLTNEIEIVDLTLKINNTLIISDIHIGYEEYLNQQGYLLPITQYKDTIKRLEKIFEKTGKLKTIIINGDLKHEFGNISETEWRNTLNLIDFLLEKCEKIVLIKGNHDKILEPIAEKRNIEVVDSYKLNNILILHGDKIPKEINEEIIIIGHEHPSIGLQEDARIETFKCFLKGKWKDKQLIVMPSFNLVTEGSDILREEVLSPFLKQDLSEFEVFVIDRKVLKFGILKDLK
ncbi:MAG: metallophosphoesterase [Nanoarchaeota archaeon]|nr:metallophosphoesterase [Nanoarchaeota archaeon]MBU4241642.1 metallophosphoesterase [Nanoarchaeota archaeon]MBU4351930.1 metallophosphoesterase [Nanoarchaeota archaeon]MBU4456120.1 metallophosphoesterase [Nanoarchaeota archaeon]MCG2720272.1 metallophosphoesterase [Nanoarchaeota archaeon]